MKTNITKKLFFGTYQYKIALVCVFSRAFKVHSLNNCKELINTVVPYRLSRMDNNGAALDYALEQDVSKKLVKCLLKMSDYKIRIEHAYINIYTNNKKDITTISKIDKLRIRYIAIPPDNIILEADSLISNMPYDYRITLTRTVQDCQAFVQWADASSKVKLTKGTALALSSPNSNGGTYFYITGDNMLLMAKMHLGSYISRIERLIKLE